MFHDRQTIEAGISRMLSGTAADDENCAVLFVDVQGVGELAGFADHAVSRKMLGLAANIMRARINDGAVAYIGGARFAVMLQGVSGQQAVAYCRSVIEVLAEIRLHWRGVILSVCASIGGVMAEGRHDGTLLLELAEEANTLARRKSGCRIHMLHGQ